MAPLRLEGENLGKIHQHFNTKVNECLQNKVTFEEVEKQYHDSDLDNLLKIDIASEYRNVEYILQVFKSEDMLYVSRAIKKSTWLITDDQYAHIINPQHLHSELFPYMTSRAICKLLLHIRLNLKNESRVDDFFNYYKEIDFNKALKWLPGCSLPCIEVVIEKYYLKITVKLFQRLCEKSFTVFKKYTDTNTQFPPRHRFIKLYFDAVLFLLKDHTEDFLNILEKWNNSHYWPKFNKKYTGIIMKNSPDRILNNFEKYSANVDLATVGQHLGAENIKDFIIKLSNNEKLLLWFKYNNLKPLVKLMPKEGKFEFLKTMFINKEKVVKQFPKLQAQSLNKISLCFGAAPRVAAVSSQNVYDWYRHATFEVAFPDLQKLIKTESSPEERGAILRVLLTTAGRNMNHIQTLLKYYHDKHINEAFKYKVNFINAVISITDTHKYDDHTWKILDEIFHNMEIYIESENNAQKCIEAIIVYKILHKQPIPELVEKKYKFNSFKRLKEKLNKDQRDEIFKYHYNILEKKLNNQCFGNQQECNDSIALLVDIFDFLTDWDKELINYPKVLNMIKELVKLRKNKGLSINLEMLYNKKKSWRKYMFEESLLMSHTEEVCLNILRHDPTLLGRYTTEVDAIRGNDSIILRRLMSKLRIYCSRTAEEWASFYRTRIDQPTGHRALTRGLCSLLPRDELENLFVKYAPSDPKIVWSEIDEVLLSLRKNFARQMHTSRPQPQPTTILLYAKGAYLQYALPSLTAIFYNLSSHQSREYLPLLLKGPVSLRKHGIRYTFAKLSSSELENTFSHIWNTSTSASIRAVIFQQTFELLCREKNSARIADVWKLLEKFIDNLSFEENKNIYVILGKVDKVPEDVKAEFCVKSYRMLKSLPPKANCEGIADTVALQSAHVMDKIDPDFVADILLDFINVRFVMKKSVIKTCQSLYWINILNVLSAYLIHSADEAEQMRRFDKVMKPLLDQIVMLWNENTNLYDSVQSYFDQLIFQLVKYLKGKLHDTKIVIPVKMFEEIKKHMEVKLPVVENYHTITFCKFIVIYVKCCDKRKEELHALGAAKNKDVKMKMEKEDKTWTIIRPLFAKECFSLLKQDIQTYFPSIQVLYKNALKEFHHTIVNCSRLDFEFINDLIENNDYIPAYLTAIDFLPPMQNCTNELKIQLKDIFKTLNAHPSMEVKMHLFKKRAY